MDIQVTEYPKRYPPETEEQKTALYSWFPSRTPQTAVPKIPKILKDIEDVYGKKTWGAVGVIIPSLSYKLTPPARSLLATNKRV
jgi:hypothetical protein